MRRCKRKLRAYYSGKGAEGYRVLGLATKRTPAKPRYDRDDEAKWCSRASSCSSIR